MWTFWAKNSLKKQKKTDKVYQSFSFIMAKSRNFDTIAPLLPIIVKRFTFAPPKKITAR